MNNHREIQTVLGKIPSSQLGVTDAHTHLVRLAGPLADSSSDFRLDNESLAIEELRGYRAAGGGSVVDMTPSIPGRSVELLAQIARQASVHVVASTGFVEWGMYPGTIDWLKSASIEELSTLISAEVTQGCDANNYTSPIIRRSSIRAGVIKVATGYQVITELQKKILRASAAAHRQTGAPISVHTESGTCVLELVDILVQERVAPSSILVSHTFLNPDPGYQHDIAQTGIYLVQDGPGRVKYFPESNTIHQIQRFVEDGFEDQLLLAGDHSRRSYFRTYGGGPGFDYILSTFVPRLHKMGIPEGITRKMLVDNAANAFSLSTQNQ